MKSTKQQEMWYFVDEAGDPTFYDKRGKLIVGQSGCSPILILGFVQVSEPEIIRRAIRSLQQEVINDPYFHGRRSLAETAKAFHANNDLFEIKYLFFRLIAQLDFRAHFIVARKVESIFIKYDNRKQNAFYDHIISCLFEGVLHLHEHNHIYFAKRQSRARQAPLLAAIERSKRNFYQYRGKEITTNCIVQAQSPSHEPCLSIIDYLNWAIYQAYIKQDMNYFNVVRDKVSLIADIYDKRSSGGSWYNRKNPFDVKKITPLQLVPSEGHTA